MRVFSTDNFRPCVGPRYICDRRSPGCREDAFIFDGQVQLQELATMPAVDVASRQPILFFVPLERILYVVVFA